MPRASRISERRDCPAAGSAVLVLTVQKRARRADGWIARLREIGDEDRVASLRWSRCRRPREDLPLSRQRLLELAHPYLLD